MMFGHFKILPDAAGDNLTQVAFWVAIAALMFLIISRESIDRMLNVGFYVAFGGWLIVFLTPGDDAGMRVGHRATILGIRGLSILLPHPSTTKHPSFYRHQVPVYTSWVVIDCSAHPNDMEDAMSMWARLVGTVGVVFLVSSHVAVAQDTIPDILGFWDGVEQSGVAFDDRSGWDEPTSVNEFEILEQTGHAFSGVWRWSLIPETLTRTGFIDSEEAIGAEEVLLGVFSGDGVSFVIAEHPDAGYIFGRMIDANRMEIMYVEAGEFALAMRHVFERRQ